MLFRVVKEFRFKKITVTSDLPYHSMTYILCHFNYPPPPPPNRPDMRQRERRERERKRQTDRQTDRQRQKGGVSGSTDTDQRSDIRWQLKAILQQDDTQHITDLVATCTLITLQIQHGGLQIHYVTLVQVVQVLTDFVGGHLEQDIVIWQKRRKLIFRHSSCADCCYDDKFHI